MSRIEPLAPSNDELLKDAPATPPARDLEKAGCWLMLTAIALGIVCRIAQYAANRSYWTDEASLVLNIRNLTAGQLLGPLRYSQAAPPLFLLIERGLFRIAGGGEMSLRIFPVVGGIAGLVLFAVLARRVLRVDSSDTVPSTGSGPALSLSKGPWDAVAVFLYATADRLIFHNTEVKPYGTDVLVCVLFLLLAIDTRESGNVVCRCAAWHGWRR